MAADEESSSDSSSEDERKKESFEEKMKRITKLGREGNMDELIKEAQLSDCTASMVEFAAKKSKDLGNEAFAKKNYEQALEHYAGALVGDCPEKHKIYSNRSACLFQLGKYTDALVEATKSIKENRAWSKGYYRAGRAALEMEYYDEAYDMFQKGLEKDPANKDLIEWAEKAKTVRNQHNQNKLLKKHTTDYSKFDDLAKQQQDEEDEEAMENDPNAIVFGDRYYSSSKMEQRQLKAMLGYKEEPPPPFEPTFDTDLIYRHDSRGVKTQNPIWDPSRREWRIDAKPAPSRVDYSDSTQTQAIAMFLERQSEVAYVDELLTLLDERATPITAYINGVRDLITQILGSDGKGHGADFSADNARWLFVGAGTTMPFLTAAKYLPTAEIIACSAARGVHIADLSLALMKDNGVRKEQFRFLHRPSHELAIVDPDGEDINNLTGRVDIVTLDYNLFDPGLLGKGVLAKVNHIKKKLATSNHLFMPMGAAILCLPIQMISPRSDGPDGLDWSAIDDCRWAAFYETCNLDATTLCEPWEALGPVHEVFEFDFTENEVKLSGQTDLRFTATKDGVLNCIAFWYRLSLTEKVVIDHTPEEFRSASLHKLNGDYYRHATQWLAAPVDVSKGEEIHLRASYSRARVRFEVVSPEVPKKLRRFSCPRWLYIRWQDEDRIEAYRKAIEKALEKIMATREAVPKLDRPPLRLIHMGAGIGQVSMVMAKCAREAGMTEADIETYGSTVIAFEQMPKVGKLAKQVIKDNDLEDDIYWCSEDVRKIPTQPNRAQLLVTEMIDPGLLGEGILVLTPPARVKTCNALDGHEMIPARGKIWAAAFQFGEYLNSFEGFNVSLFNHYRNGNMVDLDTMIEKDNVRQLSIVFEALSFDFENNILPHKQTIKINPIEDGTITAIAFWYEVAMDTEGEIILTNWPEAIPPADFSMLEKDLHRPKPLRQGIHYFQGEYCKEVTKGEPVEIDIGYTQAWPQFIWPGTQMVQKESGEMIPKPPPMPRHRMYYEKMKFDTEEMEKKLQGGLMFDEEMLGDGYAAAERVALEPNGNPNYTIDPNHANYFHMMFFL